MAVANPIQVIHRRYEIRESLFQGGMGVVFKAFDRVRKHVVALKTIGGAPDGMALRLFEQECRVLLDLSHPNIVEVYDFGEFETAEGTQRPFFVMPLLKGKTLDKLIGKDQPRLALDRCTEILCQTCKGLQAAHDAGLIHRDLKPSNIFVLNDDSVKIIDFGIAHIVNTDSEHGRKGTLPYMSPEQLQMKAITPASDLFSLGIVAFECLAGQRPFIGSEEEITDAILHKNPPLASTLNPALNPTLCKILHKALAKKPVHRFEAAKNFSDMLSRAARNEAFDPFPPERIRPRLDRATKAYSQADFPFAIEILDELKAEGYINSEVLALDEQVQTASRRKRVTQLLDSARTRMAEHELLLALQKVQEAIELDTGNTDAAALKNLIDDQLSSERAGGWLRIGRDHLSNRNFDRAGEAAMSVLRTQPENAEARRFLAEVEQQKQEYHKRQEEKQRLFRAAQCDRDVGAISSAISKLERALELDRQAPDLNGSERALEFQNFYNQVRSEREAIERGYAEVRRLLTEEKFKESLETCDKFLEKYRNNAVFGALRIETEEKQRQHLSAFILQIESKLASEPDLERRLAILDTALQRYPGERHLEEVRNTIRKKLDFVKSLLARAKVFEERGQFAEALDELETLRRIYDRHATLERDIERLKELRLQADGKSAWITQIKNHQLNRDLGKALNSCVEARSEYPSDSGLQDLETSIRRELGNSSVEKAFTLCEAGETAFATMALQADPMSDQARNLDKHVKNRSRILVSNNHGFPERKLPEPEPIDRGMARCDTPRAPASKRRTLIAATTLTAVLIVGVILVSSFYRKPVKNIDARTAGNTVHAASPSKDDAAAPSIDDPAVDHEKMNGATIQAGVQSRRKEPAPDGSNAAGGPLTGQHFEVTIETIPSGAQVRIIQHGSTFSKCMATCDLPEGEYYAKADMDGYVSVTRPLSIPNDKVVSILLVPGASLIFSLIPKGSSVLIDGKPVDTSKPMRVLPGKYEVEVTTQSGERHGGQANPEFGKSWVIELKDLKPETKE